MLVFLLPISARIQKLINWIFIKINLDFIFKSNILPIISRSATEMCAGLFYTTIMLDKKRIAIFIDGVIFII